MSENRKLKKRNLHGEESDGKRVVKIQKQKKQKVKNVVLTEQSLQAESSKKPKLKKKNTKEKTEEIISSPVSEKMQKKRKAKVDNTHISESEVTSDEKMRVKKRKLNKIKNKRKAEQIITAPVDETEVDGDKSFNEAVNADGTQVRNRKPKKTNKKKKMDLTSTEKKEINIIKEEEDVYQISSGDEDCSNGMKKWVTDYYESRPGLDVLQKRIDDFITAHEENLEQEKQNREAKAAEGGWTVVVHHKGRKKTTESESGTAVGSVSQVALEDQLAKKKQNEPVAHGFYRFQRQEAKLNDLLTLQSKFEQDKKRIQQLRAARKFKPFGIRLVDEA